MRYHYIDLRTNHGVFTYHCVGFSSCSACYGLRFSQRLRRVKNSYRSWRWYIGCRSQYFIGTFIVSRAMMHSSSNKIHHCSKYIPRHALRLVHQYFNTSYGRTCMYGCSETRCKTYIHGRTQKTQNVKTNMHSGQDIRKQCPKMKCTKKSKETALQKPKAIYNKIEGRGL